jgi:hypothetical protein
MDKRHDEHPECDRTHLQINSAAALSWMVGSAMKDVARSLDHTFKALRATRDCGCSALQLQRRQIGQGYSGCSVSRMIASPVVLEHAPRFCRHRKIRGLRAWPICTKSSGVTHARLL